MANWRPSSGPEVAAERAALQSRIRDYFEQQDVLSVDTPSLAKSASSDVHIESLAVTSTLTDDIAYLHTSPESHMKRLLAAGYPDIYSLCRVYRDGETGARHQIEFTMLEWYRLGFGLQNIIDEALAVIATACRRPQFVSTAIQLDYREAFIKFANVDPLQASIQELADAAAADASLRQTLGDDRDDWLDLILADKICRAFPADTLTVLRHYPISQAALSRQCPNDPLVADRFEIFLGELELANGYVELTDAGEQATRIETEQRQRHQRDLTLRKTDSQLIAALDSGLPQCAGVAIGVERLHMASVGTNDIRNVVTFTSDIAEN